MLILQPSYAQLVSERSEAMPKRSAGEHLSDKKLPLAVASLRSALA
ncbi:MAG: hypothetical protein L3J33_09345 [Rhodobacteraceae bacterium]|nr:hypothetical protein [Paracoccaceae bacterium]